VQASTLVTGPLLVKNVPYDAVKDFTAISEIGSVPLIMTVHPSVEAKSLKEFIDQQRADPKKYIFGTSPVGSAGYFATEAIKHEAKLDGMLVVPYKGTAGAIADLLAGQVSALIDAIPSSYPLAKSGKLRLIAVTSAERLPMMPDTPTVAESALPGFEMESWYGLWGPAKLPAEITQRLNAEVNKALGGDLRDKFAQQGLLLTPGSVDEFAKFQQSDMARAQKIITEGHIRVE
jgi:tripartite-type tricarboxylate transporter receptor subunit TctC